MAGDPFHSVRKETSLTHYEVVFPDGSTQWEALLYTNNWGTLKTILQRTFGVNYAAYRDKLEELQTLLVEAYPERLSSATLRPTNYCLRFIKLERNEVRPTHAFKTKPKPKGESDSDSDSDSGDDD